MLKHVVVSMIKGYRCQKLKKPMGFEFIGGTIVTFIFGFGGYVWTSVAFGGFMKLDRGPK